MQDSFNDINARVVADEDQMLSSGVPEKASQFLAAKGLPANAPLHITFSLGAFRLHSLNQFARESGQIEVPGGDFFYRIGSDEVSHICIEKETEFVFSIALDNIAHRQFINSSIANFSSLLDCFSEYSVNVRGMEEDEAIAYVSVVIEEMHKIDGAAFRDPDNWWPSITQQMEHGLL